MFGIFRQRKQAETPINDAGFAANAAGEAQNSGALFVLGDDGRFIIGRAYHDARAKFIMDCANKSEAVGTFESAIKQFNLLDRRMQGSYISALFRQSSDPKAMPYMATGVGLFAQELYEASTYGGDKYYTINQELLDCLNAIGGFCYALDDANDGDTEAQFFVATAYMNSGPDGTNYRLAKVWLERAAEGGNKKAQDWISRLSSS